MGRHLAIYHTNKFYYFGRESVPFMRRSKTKHFNIPDGGCGVVTQALQVFLHIFRTYWLLLQYLAT